MIRCKPIGRAALVLIALIGNLVARQDPSAVECKYSTKIKVTEGESADASKPSKTHSAKLALRLWPEAYAFATDGEWTVVDFAARRIVVPSNVKGRVAESSLFPLIAFRRMEFQNRLMQLDLLRSAKADVNGKLPDEVQLECLFSIEAPGAPDRKLDRKETGRVVSWSHDSSVLARCEFSDDEVPEALSRTFSRWLAREHRLHPAIRREITKRGRLPKSLWYTWRDVPMASELQLDLETTAALKPPPPARPAASSVDHRSDPLGPAFTKAWDPKTRAARLKKEDFVKASEDALGRKDHIGALLAVLELSLQEGSMAPEQLRKVASAGKEVESFQSYFATYGKIDPKDALRIIEGVDRKGIARAHLIDINCAVHYSSLKDSKRAIELYKKALEVNPLLVGAWKDLGDIFESRYEMELAWECRDLARDLVPDHMMLKGIEGEEARLVKLFPDCF